MAFYQFIAIGLSLVAVIIALHTKYKQREKEKLRELANKLKILREYSEEIENLLYNPRSHEDLDLRLYEIPREMLACRYETESNLVSISPAAKSGYGEGRQEFTEVDEIFARYKNQGRFQIELTIGNRDEMYASDRRFYLPDPFHPSAYLYEEIPEIEDEFGDIIEEFDDSILEDLESHIDSMVRKHCTHITGMFEGESVNVEEFGSTEDIGQEVFRRLFFYDGIEEDLEELDRILEELEDLRTTVLQASYS